VGIERNVRFSVTYEATPHDDMVLLEGEGIKLDKPTALKDTSTPPDPPTQTPILIPANRPERCSACT
jgi:hypothetical protein